MAADLFRVAKGLSIESEDQSSQIDILQGTGAPVGTSGETNSAAIGSIYLQSDPAADTLNIFFKKANGGVAADWSAATDDTYVDAAIVTAVDTNASWRKPAKVNDTTLHASVAAAVTAANIADTVDSITIVAGDRILLSNLTAGNENVYIVSGSTGAWVFTEDANTASDGDVLVVQQGTDADAMWKYDGTGWAEQGTGNETELAFIRTYIGKSGSGSETPTYSSTVYVSTATSLETAIGALDAQANTQQTEVDAIEGALGAVVNASGAYVAHTGTTYLNTNTSITNDLLDLDIAIDANATNITNNLNEINAIETSLGAVVNASGVYVAHTGTTYLNTNTSITNDLLDLDIAIDANATSIGTNTTNISNNLTEINAIETSLGAVVSTAGVYVAHTGTTYINGNTTLTADLLDLDIAAGNNATAITGKVSKAGDTMDANADLTFTGGGEVLGLPATPSGVTAATSKAYVDALISGSSWKDPVVDSDLIEITAANPGTMASLITTYSLSVGDNVCFIASATITFDAGGTTVVGTTAGDIVNLTVVSGTVGDYSLIETPLAAGDRFIVAAEHGTVGAVLTAFDINADGFTVANGDLIEYVSGTITTAASWSTPDGRSGNAGGGTELAQGVTVLNSDPDSVHYGHTFLYDAVANAWVEISGPGSIGDGTGLLYSGNVLNVNMGAGVTALPADEVGIDVHASGGLHTTVDGTAVSTVTASQLAVKLDGTTLTKTASGLRVNASIQNEIDAIETSLGAVVNASGVYQAFTGTTFLDGNSSITEDIDDLDNALGTTDLEAGFIRTFIGKSGIGSETPTYSSTFAVSTATSLETAIGTLDSMLGDGEITTVTASHILTDEMLWGAAGTLTITGALDALNTGIGSRLYTSSGTNVTSGETTTASIDALNEALIAEQNQSLEISGTTTFTALTDVDTLLLADATQVKWIIQVRETATPANMTAMEVHAITDGTSVDFSKFVNLKLGSKVTGLSVDVSFSTGSMRLQLDATPQVDWVVKRVAYTAFA